MSYLWKEFNIKTFPAETIVFRNGEYVQDLSTIENGPINKKYDSPVHIIYFGEIDGDNNLNIDVNVAAQKVFLTVKLKNKKPAFLNIFIKNTGKNSEILGHVLIENNDDFNFDCTALHAADDTTVLVQTRLVAGKNSKSKLSGTAVIEKNINGAVSDINFAAMADTGARIEFAPRQRIASAPTAANHSASIYTPAAPQINYLRGGGLSGAEVDAAMKEAFVNSFSLF